MRLAETFAVTAAASGTAGPAFPKKSLDAAVAPGKDERPRARMRAKTGSQVREQSRINQP